MEMEQKISSKQLAQRICKALSEKRGRDIVTLYVRERTALCDYFVIASASKGEGKTTVAVNLAVTLAQNLNRSKVLLVDCDLRNSGVELMLSKDYQGRGLAEFLSGADKEPNIVCDTIEPCPQYEKAEENKPNKKVKHGLFMRVPSQESELTARAENLLAIFDGNTPAYFYYNDSKKYSAKAVAVDVNDPLIKELKRILGSENVVFQ
jgi:Mrp family chromosome partitioning ATPase